jgi:glycosyltransferase involved in cell wall biosynthesis
MEANMIFILCSCGFPNGTEPTGRVTGYSKGMIRSGEEVFLLLLRTSEYGQNILNHQVKGNMDGIPYEYTCGTPFRGKTFLKRRWLSLKGILVATLRLFQIRNKKHIEALILWELSTLTTLWFWMISRIVKIPLLLEEDEHPFRYRGVRPADKLYKYLYTRLVLWRFDGVIVISDYLKTYLGKILRPGVKMIKVPIIVDRMFFNKPTLPIFPESRNITYCGHLNEDKDGVLTLMKAFREIYQDYPKLFLRVIGDDYKESKVPEYKKYSEELGIAERVEFVGKVARDQVPGYLQRASILALARPTSLQTVATVSTKLGEYLASGKPVVVTRTGELVSYLEDGVNVYLSEPDNHHKFAERLRYVLDHPVEAQEIGIKGQKFAQENFDYSINMQRLVDFLKSFSTS